MYSLPFNDVAAYRPSGKSSMVPISDLTTTEAPVLKSGTFNLQTTGDTYLDMSDWGKGVVWVNGHNLGKYWGIGPQQTLYVPVEWLKKGSNDIVVLELLKPQQQTLQAVEKPILDKLKN